MYRIVNRANSPYQITDANGERQLIPAQGELIVDLDERYLAHYRLIGYFEITEVEGARTDPEPETDDLDALRAEYLAATGQEPDKRWGAARLRRGIDG